MNIRIPVLMQAGIITKILTYVILSGFANPTLSNDMTIKLATVAPSGSIYHRALQDTGSAWRTAQGGDSRFIVYTDGTQGTEATAIRRMRVGQLDAAMLSVNGLVTIDSTFGALQLMPMIFRSWDEFDFVHDHLRGDFEQRLLDKGFVVLFWGEGGWVQFFATEARITPADYADARIFTYGSADQVDIMKSMNYSPVTVELSDILASLQTGMIDVVPVAPMWSLAYQVYRKTDHMLRMNWVPISGATVMTTRTWNAMSPAAQEALQRTSARAEKELRAQRESQDEKVIAAMQENGLTVHELTPDSERAWRELMVNVWPRVRGRMVPAETFDRVQALLDEYRSRGAQVQ